MLHLQHRFCAFLWPVIISTSDNYRFCHGPVGAGKNRLFMNVGWKWRRFENCFCGRIVKLLLVNWNQEFTPWQGIGILHVHNGLRAVPSVVSDVYSPSGSSVGIATSYGLDGPGIESRWGRDFSHQSTPALGPTHNGYWVFPGGRAAGAWR